MENKTYFVKRLALLDTLFVTTALLLALTAFRKYGTDITQIPPSLRNSLSISTFLCIATSIVMGTLVIFRVRRRQILIVVLMCLLVATMFVMTLSVQVLVGDYPYIRKIDLLHLNNVVDAVVQSDDSLSYDGIYYIGRQDCVPCQSFYRTLERLTEKYNVRISYYDTLEDRSNNSDELYDILSLLSVNEVPFVFIIDAGNISERFSGDSIEIDFRNYLDCVK